MILYNDLLVLCTSISPKILFTISLALCIILYPRFHHWVPIFFSDGGYVYRTGAFLFSLNKPDNQPYKMTVYRNPQYAMCCAYNYGPTFGGGHDLYIADNCDKNTNSYSNLGYTYKLPAGYIYGTFQAKSLLAGSYNFKMDEYEVFFQPGKFTSNDRKIYTYRPYS